MELVSVDTSSMSKETEKAFISLCADISSFIVDYLGKNLSTIKTVMIFEAMGSFLEGKTASEAGDAKV